MKRVLTVGRLDKRPPGEELPAHLRDRHAGDTALPMWQEAVTPDGTVIGARYRAVEPRRRQAADKMFRLMLRLMAQEHVRHGGSRRSLEDGAAHDLLTGQATARRFSRRTGSAGA